MPDRAGREFKAKATTLGGAGEVYVAKHTRWRLLSQGVPRKDLWDHWYLAHQIWKSWELQTHGHWTPRDLGPRATFSQPHVPTSEGPLPWMPVTNTSRQPLLILVWLPDMRRLWLVTWSGLVLVAIQVFLHLPHGEGGPTLSQIHVLFQGSTPKMVHYCHLSPICQWILYC